MLSTRMKVTTPKTNFGYFGWRTSVELSDEQVAYFAGLGVLQHMQRTPATNAEKKLGNFEKRSPDFKRSDINFSDSNEDIFVKEMSAKQEIENGDVKFTINPVTECWYHDLGATAAPKYADEKRAVQKHIADGDIAEWASEKVGYTGDKLNVENIEFLQAVKTFKMEALKKEGF